MAYSKIGENAINQLRIAVKNIEELDIPSLLKDSMKIRPLHDHIIVTRVEPDTISKGGIVIPTTAQEKTTEGIVIAVGNGVHLENGKIRPLDVKNGDRILFEKYAGAEVKINGEEFTVLRESNVICVLGIGL